MAKVLTVAAAGFLLGVAASFALLHRGGMTPQDDAERASSPVIENVPKMTRAAAESHRSRRYAGLESIEETLALPGDFAQTEALYALAGRSDSAGVQELIFQAHGIADPSDRSAALDILFSRLTELDARSALALSRTAEFRGERHIEENVWHSWGKLDLDHALAAAAALDSHAERSLAAQAFYAAYDYQGNDRTKYIEEALGIPPNMATRAAYLFRLADRDPADAVRAIDAMRDSTQRQHAAGHLGHRLGRLHGDVAERHAALFRDAMAQQSYAQSVRSAVAEADPEAVLDGLLVDGHNPERMMEAYRALQSLASRDIDKALDYLERIRSPQHRETLATVVGQAFAQADPRRALAWAEENDRGLQNGLYIGMIASVAAVDPDLAVDAANRLPSAAERHQALGMAAMTISQQSPMRAVALLDQIEQPEARNSVAQNLASTWVQNDPDAAMSWILGRDGTERRAMLSMAGGVLTQMDLDRAMQWLPRLDEESQRGWRAQVASTLAQQRSVAEAQRFIRRFEHSDDYPRLLAETINGVAQVDVSAAMEMASGVPEGRERDVLYGRLVSEFGHQDPQQAATLLTSIVDDEQRTQATAMLALVWSHRDAAAAQQWAQGLPRGATRDDAIMHLTSNWDELTPSRRLLVDSIGDPEKRKRALIGHIHRVAQTDPQQAETMLHNLDLSEDEMQQQLQTISMIRTYR